MTFDRYSSRHNCGRRHYRYHSHHDEMLPLSHHDRAYRSDHRASESYDSTPVRVQTIFRM